MITNRVLGMFLLALGIFPLVTFAQQPKELTPKQQQELLTRAKQLNERGMKAYQAGKTGEALEQMRQCLEAYRLVHQGRDHSHIAKSLGNVGSMLMAMGEYDKALPYRQQALAMLAKIHTGQHHPDRAASLNNMGFLLLRMGNDGQALPYFEQALAMYRKRAFHLAGCSNVVCSLWKINDEATAAMMTKFYHELWVNKKSIIESLHAAQRLIYRRPDLIPDLAGSRGALKLKRSLTEIPTAKAVKREGWPFRIPSKYWAAFVLSGAGE